MDQDLVWNAICLHCGGRGGKDLENSSDFEILSVSPIPHRTRTEFKKLFGRRLSRRGPGSSPGFARLSDRPPVLLAQFVGQPGSTTGIRPPSLEFRDFSGGVTAHSLHMQRLIKDVNVKEIVKPLIILTNKLFSRLRGSDSLLQRMFLSWN